jgi:hypothetical protein
MSLSKYHQVVHLSNIRGDNLLPHQQIPNKVTVNLDMFSMFMENSIVTNKDSNLIVTIHLHRSRNIVVEN